ncbi:MAG: DNA polymerase I [Polyangiaceae bacterium]|nr:DNA polymerase I [Polyangiaceae bacterium]MCW5790728.1 DNA polymerase I [Polyangiaceae bacterium]
MATRLFEAGAPDVVYIVDLSGYLFRSYHAIAPLTSPSGEPTHAVFGTVNMLERLVRQCRPAMLAVAMDAKRGNFRTEIYPKYKANRPPTPDDLKSQVGRAREVIDAFNIPVLIQDGVEADDLIATSVARARELKMRVVIVSADKDLMQLVGDDVVMWDTMRNKVFGLPEVEERFGVSPAQLRDLLALMGDTSDNVPGVPSVGPKTARDLLVQFGGLEQVYAGLEQVARKKLRETLAEHREQAFLSQRLVTLKSDCPIAFNREALHYGGRDVGRLRDLYAELGFSRQLAALDQEEQYAAASMDPSAAVDPEPKEAAELTLECVVSAERLAELVRRAVDEGRLGLHVQADVENAQSHAQLVGLGLGLSPTEGYYVPIGGDPSALDLTAVHQALGPLFADSKTKKACHRSSGDELLLRRHGFSLSGLAFDASIASYLLDPESPPELPQIVAREFDARFVTSESLTKRPRGGPLPFSQVPLGDATLHAAAAAVFTLRLWDRLGQRVADEGMTEVMEELELPLTSVLSEMEGRGVLVDTQKLEAQSVVFERDLAALEAEAHELAGKEFNVASPRQLETLLFDELKLKPLKRTKTARSTDAATLAALAEQSPLPHVILEHRQLAKLKNTYIDTLPTLVNPETGRIHTRWRQTVAATGRISSVEPNLQNIPIRTELGRGIRSAFIAPKGHQLVSGDYSQIELRVLAHLSQDPVLIDAFNSDQDIHTRTAMEIFEVEASEVDAEHRRRAKAVNFGVIYGQGEAALARSLKIPRAEASSFIAAYFRRYRGVRRFLDETLEHARAGGAVRTLLGRRRLIPDLHSANRGKRYAAERIAMNTPIQGSAADILKLAMLALGEPVTPGARMILTVHDELVFEVPEAEVAEASLAIKERMESAYTLDVPLVVEVGHGATWMEAH